MYRCIYGYHWKLSTFYLIVQKYNYAYKYDYKIFLKWALNIHVTGIDPPPPDHDES